MACCLLRSAPTMASVEPGAGTVGFHPEIVPSSLANRKRAAPETPFFVTANPVPPLNTVPVGAPGTVTVRACFAPRPL